MKEVDHAPELVPYCGRARCLRLRRGVRRVRREEAERRIAPIVAEFEVFEVRLRRRRVHGKKLDRRDSQIGEALDGGGVRESRVRAAQVLRDVGHELREALDVRLVEHGVSPRSARLGGWQRAVVVGHHDRAGHEGGGIGAVTVRVEHACAGRRRFCDDAVEPPAVGVEQELRLVVAVAALGRPGPRRAEAIALAGRDPLDKAVPVAVRRAVERDACLRARIVKEAQFNAGRVGGEDRHRDASVDRVNAKTERIGCGRYGAGGGDRRRRFAG